jgi:hypothetical protein
MRPGTLMGRLAVVLAIVGEGIKPPVRVRFQMNRIVTTVAHDSRHGYPSPSRHDLLRRVR